MTPESQTVLERLERLEAQNRRLRRAGAVALAAVAALVLMGQAAPKRRIVQAEKFVLVDQAEKTRAELRLAEGASSQLVLYNEKGNVGTRLSTDVGGSTLQLSDEFGMGTSLTAAMGGGGVGLYKLKRGTQIPERLLFELAGGAPDDNASLHLFGGKGKGTAWASLVVSDKKGSALEISDKEGFASILGTASSETKRTGERQTTSAASLVLVGKDGKVIWRAP